MQTIEKYRLAKYGKENPYKVSRFTQAGKECYAALCPCRKRTVFLVNHKVSFDEEGLMSVENSIAISRNQVPHFGYCHFHIQDGTVQFYEDATCKGAQS